MLGVKSPGGICHRGGSRRYSAGEGWWEGGGGQGGVLVEFMRVVGVVEVDWSPGVGGGGERGAEGGESEAKRDVDVHGAVCVD